MRLPRRFYTTKTQWRPLAISALPPLLPLEHIRLTVFDGEAEEIELASLVHLELIAAVALDQRFMRGQRRMEIGEIGRICRLGQAFRGNHGRRMRCHAALR